MKAVSGSRLTAPCGHCWCWRRKMRRADSAGWCACFLSCQHSAMPVRRQGGSSQPRQAGVRRQRWEGTIRTKASRSKSPTLEDSESTTSCSGSLDFAATRISADGWIGKRGRAGEGCGSVFVLTPKPGRMIMQLGPASCTKRQGRSRSERTLVASRVRRRRSLGNLCCYSIVRRLDGG